MANYKIKFLDRYDENTIECFEDENSIVIVLNEMIGETTTESLCIVLDKSTAIKFAKTLRTEINKITESEGDNE